MLYDAHLAEAVDENVKPIYNQHIWPVYEEHVSPVVRAIEGEAVIVAEKTSKGAKRARSGAARLVRQSSSSALGAMKEKEIDSMLPGWLVSLLDRASSDGEWAFDGLCKSVLIIAAILFRSLLWRLFWDAVCSPFRLVWFFCPLRFVMGGRRKAETNER